MQRKFIYYLVLITWTVYGCIATFYFEKIPLNDGFGYDGKIYAYIAANFPSVLTDNSLSSYYSLRILPSLVLNIVFRVFQIPFSPGNTVTGFCFFNLVCIFFCIILWNKISGKMKFGAHAWLAGILVLLINYPVLRLAFFDPAYATDYFALLSGFGMLYGYLVKKPVQIFLWMIAGAFTWPLAIPAGGILFIFCNHEPVKTIDIRKYVFYGFLILFTACILYEAFILDWRQPNTKYPIAILWLPLSCAAVAGYLFFISRLPLFEKFPFSLTGSKNFFLKVLAVAVLFGAVTIFALQFSNPAEYSVSPFSVVLLSFIRAVERPFIFIIAHSVFFGPVVIVLIVFWKKIISGISATGLQLYIFIHLLLALNSESRFLLMGLPVFILVSCTNLATLKVKRGEIVLFVILSLIASKIWLSIGYLPEGGSWQQDAVKYYSSIGPWMSNWWYVVQGFAMTGSLGLLYYVLWQRKRSVNTTL